MTANVGTPFNRGLRPKLSVITAGVGNEPGHGRLSRYPKYKAQRNKWRIARRATFLFKAKRAVRLQRRDALKKAAEVRAAKERQAA